MRNCLSVAILLGVALCSRAQAQDAGDEVPAFDRPGIGLGTGIVPRGALALEFGLPSYQRDRDREGVRTEQFSSEATVRTGLADHWELQLSGTPWQRERIRVRGADSERSRGSGDSEVAVKWAPDTGSEDNRWALLGTATLARGDAAFTEGRQYALAATYEHDFTEAGAVRCTPVTAAATGSAALRGHRTSRWP